MCSKAAVCNGMRFTPQSRYQSVVGTPGDAAIVEWMWPDRECPAINFLKTINPCAEHHSLKEAIHHLNLESKKDDDQRVCVSVYHDEPGIMEDWKVDTYDTVGEAVKALKRRNRELEKAEEATNAKIVEAKFREKFGKERPDISHMVVLMLENRTFDGVQGDYMNERYQKGEVKRSQWDRNGKDLYSYTNTVQGEKGPVKFPAWTVDRNDPQILSKEVMSTPAGPAGPVEKFAFLNMAVYGVLRPTDDDVAKGPNMDGFAEEYYKKEKANMPEDGSTLRPESAATCFKTNHSPVMYIYRKEQMCVLTDLMDNFGCSDTHFSSAPCQTWPNRLFASCGTCYGYVNNLPYVQPDEDAVDDYSYFQSDEVNKFGAFEKITTAYDTETIFDRLQDNGASWGIYQGSVSLAVITTKLKWELPSIASNVHTLEDFNEDCSVGDLPMFCWLEPNYGPGTPEENDMHPPCNVLTGQHLIKDIYNSLRANEEVWKKTLFIVTCDEGVGSFDHVHPPAAVDPVVGHDHEYVHQPEGPEDWSSVSPYEMSSNPFTRYGTRVPNLMVSPHIAPKTVVRPQGNDQGTAKYPFDHTSIIRTAFDLFLGDPTEHLTERDKAAPSFVHCLSKDVVNMGPRSICAPEFVNDLVFKHAGDGCHGVGAVTNGLMGSGQDEVHGVGGVRMQGGCFQVPHAMQSSFTSDLAAFFGV